ncbi:MAG TPA: phosphatase PAP2 family protein [Thermoanaerobaculia bacterium]|nr:phosphatase PAP2 family protein [Thermoanaerobaculia bacterium]
MNRIAALLLILIALPIHADDIADSTADASRTERARSEARMVSRQLWTDVKGLTTAPLHWDRTEWERFGAGAAAVAIVYAEDRNIYNLVQRNRSHATDQYARAVTHFGGGVAQDIAILLLGAGYATGNTTARNTGFDALEAEVWAAGIVTPSLKRIAGRARPIQEMGPHSFKPFSSCCESFPSGHSTNAWALATVVADHSNGWLMPTLAYTVATSVSMARVNDRAHFPSEVLAGALIGRAVGKSIVNRHRNSKRAEALSVVPIADGHNRGLVISTQW